MYQEATEKAEEKGLEQGEEKGERETWRASLMLAVNRLFLALAAQAEQVGRATEDPKQLQQVVSAIFVAQTEEEARQALTLPH